MDDDTLLIVIGDHGMTETGDHGGDSKPELESALFLYSKKSIFIEDIYIKSRVKDQSFRIVEQINLTPTLALLLGIPIPFSNLGIVIDDVFEKLDRFNPIKANYLQVSPY